MASVTSTTVIDRESSRRQRVEPGLVTVLADYEIHQSTPQPDQSDEPEGQILIGGHTLRQRQPSDFDPTLADHPLVPHPVSNPSWWETTYRRVPLYRPVNTTLDLEERRQNPVFRTVGAFMLTGCLTIASCGWAWRNTLGQFTDIGLHKVGGEW